MELGNSNKIGAKTNRNKQEGRSITKIKRFYQDSKNYNPEKVITKKVTNKKKDTYFYSNEYDENRCINAATENAPLSKKE